MSEGAGGSGGGDAAAVAPTDAGAPAGAMPTFYTPATMTAPGAGSGTAGGPPKATAGGGGGGAGDAPLYTHGDRTPGATTTGAGGYGVRPLPTDGFVSTVGNPELGSKYGNLATGVHAMSPLISGPAPTDIASDGSRELTAEELAIVGALQELRKACADITPALKGMNARKLKEGGEAVDTLETSLHSAKLTDTATAEMAALATAVGDRNLDEAMRHHGILAANEWAAYKSWLKGLKYLLQIAQSKLK